MPSKTEEYLALAQRTANGLTRYWESWTDYLTTEIYTGEDTLSLHDALPISIFMLKNGRRPKCQAKPKNISPLPSAQPTA